MNKKFSLIIPAFNSGWSIKRCLLSCCNQDIKPDEYEIIVVNDGSTDNSLEIIMDFSRRIGNIMVINKTNEGASTARNKGLDLATGKYIWFIDSDDWIEPNCLNKIYKIMRKDQLDALQIGYYMVINGINIPCEEKYRVTTPVLNPKAYISPELFIGGSCGTIFKRQISEKYLIRFDETLKLAEDQLYILSIFYHSIRVKRENILTYYYLIHSQSISNNLDEEQLYYSISKIGSFTLRKSFKEYCDYLIWRQFLLLMRLPAKKLSRVQFLMKSISLDKRLIYKYFRSWDRLLLSVYSYLGLLSLIMYSFIRIIYKTVKSSH